MNKSSLLSQVSGAKYKGNAVAVTVPWPEASESDLEELNMQTGVKSSSPDTLAKNTAPMMLHSTESDKVDNLILCFPFW